MGLILPHTDILTSISLLFSSAMIHYSFIFLLTGFRWFKLYAVWVYYLFHHPLCWHHMNSTEIKLSATADSLVRI